MHEESTLRPLERRVLRLIDDGVDEAEIARRFRRSPESIGRVIELARLPGRKTFHSRPEGGLRPLERRVLHWRDRGADYADIGSRFRHSPAFMQRVEAFAHYKLGAV
jgi:hypothetical protein